MSDESVGMQFEKAELEGSASASCAFCKRPGLLQYFDINGRVACDNCREQIRSQLEPEKVNYLQAFGLGLGAAVVSGVLYGFTRKLTEFNIGLIAVGVGWLVGRAVR